MSVPSASGTTPGGDRRRRAAAGAARHPVRVVRVAGAAVPRVLGGDAPGELVRTRAAEDHRAGRPQPRDRDAVGRRGRAGGDVGARPRGLPGDVEQVLDPDRHTLERPRPEAARPGLGAGGVRVTRTKAESGSSPSRARACSTSSTGSARPSRTAAARARAVSTPGR